MKRYLGMGVLLSVSILTFIVVCASELKADTCRNGVCFSDNGTMSRYDKAGKVVFRYYPRYNKAFTFENGKALKSYSVK